MADDLTLFIRDQLESRGIRIAGMDRDWITAYCFMDKATRRPAEDLQGHDERTASLRINRKTGGFRCFGCQIRGPWSLMAKLLNAEEIDPDKLPGEDEKLIAEIDQMVKAAQYRPRLPTHLEPWRGRWTRFDQKTQQEISVGAALLQRLEASRWYDNRPADKGGECYRILLPIRMHRELKGWVARRLDDVKMTKYRNSPGIKSERILFPYDFVASFCRGVVVLVEGPFDAVRLLNYGIPALAMLGTGNFTHENVIAISTLAQHVVIATDADESGMECRYETAVPFIEPYCSYEHFHAPPGLDPGNMYPQNVAVLKQMVRRAEARLSAA